MVIQKSLIQERVSNAKIVSSLIANTLNNKAITDSEFRNSLFIHEFMPSSVIYFRLQQYDGRTYAYGDPEHDLLDKINITADQTIKLREAESRQGDHHEQEDVVGDERVG